MKFSLEGKIVIVTGSGRGLGRGIARVFAESGAKVVVTSRTAAQAQATVDEIRAAGHEAHAIAVDISTKAGCEQLVAQTVAHYGDLDVLVHNAAYVPFGAMHELSEQDLRATIDTNMMAAIWLTQAARPYLITKREQNGGGGRVVFVTSLSGVRVGTPSLSHYGASKGGIYGFATGAAAELAPHGVTVNIVEPGVTRGSTFDKATDAQLAAVGATLPLGRIGEPEDVAAACLFFALPQASAITAQYISVDNGQSMCMKPWERPWA